MHGPDREVATAVAGTLALIALGALLLVLGIRTGHLGAEAAPVATETSQPQPTSVDPPANPPPTGPDPGAHSILRVVTPDPDLAAAFAEWSADLGGQYALAWVDPDGIHVLGTPADDTAWSTIKVPMSIAALTELGPEIAPQVVAAITRSDNDAALAIWSGLGAAEDAAQAVDEVLRNYDAVLTRTESQSVRPPFSPFGQTLWSLTDQARFAAGLSCAAPESAGGEVRALMAQVSPDQQWGIGRLEEAHHKGGWGPQPDGGYVARQFGDGVVDGNRFALAVSARAADGTFDRATGDLDQLIRWWSVTVAADSAAMTCP